MESFVDLKMRLAILSAVTVAVASVLYFADYIAVQIFITILLAVIGVAALREYVNLLKEKEGHDTVDGYEIPLL